MAHWLWTQKQDFGPQGAEGIVYVRGSKRTLVLANRSTWEWDGETWVQLDDMGPAGSIGLVYDAARRRVISFGTKDQKVGETWAWDGEEWTQLADTGPGPRSAAMAYDSERDRIVLFGGEGPFGVPIFADTWEWNGEEWTQLEDQGPSARVGHNMVYDAERKQIVLFGGTSSQGDLGDTWAWDGTSWKLKADFGPSPRFWHGIAYDDVGRWTVLFGGAYHTQPGPRLAQGDTWEWDGKSWISRQDMGPAPRYGARLTYDSNRQKMVLFGGVGAPDAQGKHPQLHDTWELAVS